MERPQPNAAEERYPDKKAWREIVSRYETPVLSKSIGQMLNTFIPFAVIWTLMYFSLSISYGLTLLLALPAGGFLVRIFIIGHDCGHASFFKSALANNIVGAISGTMTCTPYRAWRRDHAQHHASSGNLDKRGIGDIWTLTVDEYLALSKKEQRRYRLYRNPVILFGLGPAFLFLILHRFTGGSPRTVENPSVRRTNLALVGILLVATFTIGLKAFLLVQLPILLCFCTVGVWMFYMQHQFENVTWKRNGEWDYLVQALDGSSFYKLPRVLQWFTGNIGFHHIHHLSSRIPNYLLEKCHNENELFLPVPEITLWQSLKCMKYRLWDEKNNRLVGFGDLKKMA